MSLFTKEQEVNQIKMERSHVVILGAGASIAALPNGDRNKIYLPVMDNLIDILGLDDLVKDIPLKSNNFEDVYSFINNNPKYQPQKSEIEKRVFQYFNKLELPESPTIYDKLLLSLRKKDCVASFNWDPLLAQAYSRNRPFCEMPTVCFLHGNVTIGYCEDHGKMGFMRGACPDCGNPFYPSKLLFPIQQKNYENDYFIKNQWKIVKYCIKNAFMITIFGYGAPKSDVSAFDLMQLAWGKSKDRNLEQIEIIDIKNEKELKETWKEFIFSHHYETHKTFDESWIANHPRRTGEAYYNQYMMAKFIENNPIPEYNSLQDLHAYFQKYLNVEKKFANK